jgi:hypothetical protein
VDERLINKLATIAAELDRLTRLEANPLRSTFEVLFSIPNGKFWLIGPAKLEYISYLPDMEMSLDVEMMITNDESLNRFIEGTFNPQVETLNGHWQFKGSAEDIMILTQSLFS